MGVGFGDRLREERKRTGLNQADFAKLGCVHRNSQTEYESGKTAPNSDYLQLLSAAGVDVCYILTGVRAAGTMSQDEAGIVELLRTLSAEKRGVLITFLATFVHAAE